MNERDIFIEAMQQPDAEKRSAFLDEACGPDTKLRERVEALLHQEQGLDSFLEQPAYEFNEQPASSMEQENVGTVIGPYKLMEQIGKGGFGVVFVAEQREPVRRRVALKLIKPGMDSSEVIARFEAERQALALMDHPNIARVLDAGTTASGRPYFVMELVRGTPITTFCDENQLTPRERLSLFLPICRAVQHAHQKGIIHRDIKPSNLLVTLHDGEPVPKVIDFGVAKALNQQLTQRTIYTRFSQMIGTPLYMSPEQAEMSGLDVDTRSDIYSLGVLLYELLTGSTPFDRKQLEEAAFDEVRRIIREEEPQKPSTKLSQSGDRLRGLAAQRRTEPAKLSKMIRGDLDWIVMKALEKDRNRRYETANGFAADIQRYMLDEEVVARPPSTGYRLRKFVRRNKAAFATLAIVAAVLAAATVVSTWQAILATKAEKRAVLATREAESNEARANREKTRAEESETRALESERKLSESKEDLRETLYAADLLYGVSGAFADGNFDHMNEFLDRHRPLETEPDQRGFEWYHWARAGHLAKRSARNLSGKFYHHLAVSPDGKTIAVCGRPQRVQPFDSETLLPLCNPLLVGFSSDRVCFSPDGRFLLAADNHMTRIRVFDTKSWAQTTTLNSGWYNAVAFASEQPLMATDGQGQITLWNTSSWDPVDALPVKGHVQHLAMTPDGTKLAASVKISRDRRSSPADRVELWDLDVTKRRAIRTLTGLSVKDEIAFSPSGEFLAIGDQDGAVHLWKSVDLFEVSESVAVAAWDGGHHPDPETLSATGPIQSLAFAPDGTRLAVGTSGDDAVVVWDLQRLEQPMATIRGHSLQVNGVSFVGDANTVCACDADGYVKLWDLSRCQPYDTLPGAGLDSQMGYDKDGRLIFLDDEGTIQTWHVTRRSYEPLDHAHKYHRIALSTDHTVLAGITHDNKLRILDLPSGSLRSTSPLESLKLANISRQAVSRDVNVSRLVVSCDGRKVACLVPWRRTHGPVAVVDALTGDHIGNTSGLSRMSVWPAFSPDGQYVVTQGLEEFSSLSKVSTESLPELYRVTGQRSERCAAFSHDGAMLAIGNDSNDIRLHDVNSGDLKQILEGHTDRVQNLTFSRDGSRLVSGGRDGLVCIWKRQRKEWRLVTKLSGHSGSVEFVAVAPDNDSVASLNEDGTIQVWHAATPLEVSRNVDDRLAGAGDHLHRNQPDAALAELDEILMQAPDDLRAFELRGRAHNRRGDWNLAVEAWTAALKSAPNNQYLIESRANAYAYAQRWKESEADWDRLVQLTNESNGRYLLNRGKCYLHMGRGMEAHADLTKALTRTTSLPSIQQSIALLQFAEPVVPTRSDDWRYVTNQPSSDWASTTFDDAAWRNGRAPFVRAGTDLRSDIWLRKTFERDQLIDAPLIVHLLGYHLPGEDNVNVFLNDAKLASGRNIMADQWEHQTVYATLACTSDARLGQGENVLAIHLHVDDNQSYSYVDAGLYVQADQAALEATLKAAGERAPSSVVLQTALAERCLKQRKWEDAADYFERSAKLSPAREDIWMQAALVHFYSGQRERYDEFTGEMLERIGETNSPDIAQQVARASLVTQPTEANLRTSVKLAERALELVADNDRRYAHMAMALAEYRTGNDEAAINWAGKCISGSSSLHATLKSQALSVIALAHARLGDRATARKEMIEVEQLLKDRPPFHLGSRRSESWHDWLCSEILLEELKQMVRKE